MNDLSGRDGTLTRPDYRSRVVDSRLSKLLKAFGAVESLGRNGAARHGPRSPGLEALIVWMMWQFSRPPKPILHWC